MHGLRWNSLPPIRWVADAHIIICHNNDLDWHLLVERAKVMKLVLPLRKALHYLKETINTPIPEHVLEHLDSVQVSSDEIYEFKVKTQSRGVMGRLPSILCLYRRQNKTQQHFLLRPFASINYMARYWRAEGESSFISAILKKTTRQFKTD